MVAASLMAGHDGFIKEKRRPMIYGSLMYIHDVVKDRNLEGLSTLRSQKVTFVGKGCRRDVSAD